MVTQDHLGHVHGDHRSQIGAVRDSAPGGWSAARLATDNNATVMQVLVLVIGVAIIGNALAGL